MRTATMKALTDEVKVTAYGVNGNDGPPNPQEIEEARAFFLCWADWPGSPDLGWHDRQHEPRVLQKYGSYALKHVIERWGKARVERGVDGARPYITNGACIEAARSLDIPQTYAPWAGPNTVMRVSLDRLDWLLERVNGSAVRRDVGDFLRVLDFIDLLDLGNHTMRPAPARVGVGRLHTD